jgi:hypothetical protein
VHDEGVRMSKVRGWIVVVVLSFWIESCKETMVIGEGKSYQSPTEANEDRRMKKTTSKPNSRKDASALWLDFDEPAG